MKRIVNKKAVAINAIIGIALVLFTFIVVGGLMKKFVSMADTTQAESICRASAIARSEASITFDTWIPGDEQEFRSPLMCKTHEKIIKAKGNTLEEKKESVMRSISDLAARCWWQFGNGFVGENLFKGSFFQEKKCFICYNVIIKKTSEDDENITSSELAEFMFDKPYKLTPETSSCYLGGGLCIDQDDECGKGKAKNYSFYSAIGRCPTDEYGKQKRCCYDPDPCKNKGGICLTAEDYNASFGFEARCIYDGSELVCKKQSGSPHKGDRAYEPAIESGLWNCKEENENCYVPTTTHISYVDYIQNEGGPGKLAIISDINPGNAYGVTYTVKKSSENDWWGTASVVGGVVGITAVVVIAVVVSGGTAVPVIGAIIAGAPITSGVVAGGAGAIAGLGFSEVVTDIKEAFDSPEYDTIHIARLENITTQNDICVLVGGISGK